jgi:hypothetical protein
MGDGRAAYAPNEPRRTGSRTASPGFAVVHQASKPGEPPRTLVNVVIWPGAQTRRLIGWPAELVGFRDARSGDITPL